MNLPATEEIGDEKRDCGKALRMLCFASLLVAITTAALCGTREIHSLDIGYHLTYGYHFLETGRPVDSSPEIFTIKGTENRMPPGCWIDEKGTFRFPNANWASQTLFATVHRLGGFEALSLLQGAMVLIIAIASAGTIHRYGLSPAWAAAGICLITLCAYERFTLRPELVAYTVIAVQLYLLAGIDRAEKPRWTCLIAPIALQLFMVNSHSYWMLGPAMTLAFLASHLILLIYHKVKKSEKSTSVRGRHATILLILFLAQAGCSFANPWTWRLAIHPIQTAVFVFKNDITGGAFSAGSHPWAAISEFKKTLDIIFDASSFSLIVTWAFLAVTLLSCAAAVTSAIRGKWSFFFIILGFTALSLSMRRNIAPGAIILVPSAIVMLGTFRRKNAEKRSGTILIQSTAIISLLVSVLVGTMIITSSFYWRERRPDRFGVGASRINLPIEAGEFISNTLPGDRIWTDYNSSSNYHFFSGPRHKVPILTNTWAYPVEVMQKVLYVTRGFEEVNAASIEYDFHAVALMIDNFTAEPVPGQEVVPIALSLSADPTWTLVHLDGIYAVFVRNTGPMAEIAKRHEILFNITPNHPEDPGNRRYDAWQKFIERLRNSDAVPAAAFYRAAHTLSLIGWNTHAIKMLDLAIEEDDSLHEAWFLRGLCFYKRADILFKTRDWDQSNKCWQEGKRCLRKCLEIEPDFTPAKVALERKLSDGSNPQVDEKPTP